MLRWKHSLGLERQNRGEGRLVMQKYHYLPDISKLFKTCQLKRNTFLMFKPCQKQPFADVAQGKCS